MPLREYILHNIWWKVLSLLLAALTYLTIQTAFQKDQNLRETPVEGSFSRSFPMVPITLLTSAANSARYRVEPAAAIVKLSGSREALAKLQEKQVHAYVDVSDAGDEKQFRRTVQAQVPEGLQVESLFPVVVSVERVTLAN